MQRNEKVGGRTINIRPGSKENFLKGLTPPIKITNYGNTNVKLQNAVGPCKITSHEDRLEIALLSAEEIAALKIDLAGVGGDAAAE